MAVTPPALTAAIIAAGPELKGPDFAQLATVVGIAIVTWWQSPTNLTVTGVTTGVAGAGTVNGKLFVSPDPSPMIGAFAASGLLGPNAASLARAIGTGLAVTINASGQYVGVSAGVGTGSDVVAVLVPNTAALTGILMTSALPRFSGFDVQRLSTAIAAGTSAIMLTGKGTGAVTGPGGPAPAAGTSISRVV